MTNQAAVFLPQVQQGTLKVYGVLAAQRLPFAKDIPTADEAGLPGFHVGNWNGFWVPKATPRAVVTKLNAAVRKIMADPDMRGRMLKLTYEMPADDQLTPDALAALQTAEIQKWWPIIKAAGISAN